MEKKMKKALILVLVVAVLAMSVAAFASVKTTRHNLAVSGAFVKTDDAEATVCGFCHIPHGGQFVDGVPLWARSLPPAVSFTVYGQGSKTLSGTSILAPGTFSLTCLSCHDGSIAVSTITKNGMDKAWGIDGAATDLYIVDTAGIISAYIAPDGTKYQIGKDLRDDHPVGFAVVNYNNTTGKGPGIVNSKVNGGSANADFGASVGEFPLYQNSSRVDSMECATCHDPHLADTGSGTGTQTKFLRAPNNEICTDCHNTK
jgi:predicted CXXCH cytochrome family protein